MTYIDYINRFSQWLESNALPPSAQLMYYKLLHVFNRAGWPPSVQVDNHRLMVMVGLESTKSAIRIRNKLVKAGMIRYKPGRKGVPNRYTLCEISLFPCKNDTESATISGTKSDAANASRNSTKSDAANASRNGTENGTQNATENVTENANHRKNKKKKKTETFPPKPPRGFPPVSSKAYDIADLERLSVLKLPENL